jgi:transcription antitermination factor NusG
MVYVEIASVGDGAKLYVLIETNVQTATANVALAANAWTSKALMPNWYVAYTSANHEKRVSEQLQRRSVEHFLPVYESMRKWKDRRVKLQMPLFPGYVFVRFAWCDRLTALQVPGVARLVGFNGQPAILADAEIEGLRTTIAAELRIEPHPYLRVGRRVRIQRGALQGTEGILIRKKNSVRVVLSIDAIMRSVSVEVDADDLEIV